MVRIDVAEGSIDAARTRLRSAECLIESVECSYDYAMAWANFSDMTGGPEDVRIAAEHVDNLGDQEPFFAQRVTEWKLAKASARSGAQYGAPLGLG